MESKKVHLQESPSYLTPLSNSVNVKNDLKVLDPDLDPHYSPWTSQTSLNKNPHVSSQAACSSSFYLSTFIPSYELKTTHSNKQPLSLMQNPYCALLNEMNRNGRCFDVKCMEQSCLQIQTLFKDIQESWKPDMKPLKSIHLDLMEYMYDHCCSAQQRCPFHWCLSQVCWDISSKEPREKKIEEIHKRLINLIDTNIPKLCLKDKHFIKLDQNLSLEVLHSIETTQWTRLCMMGRSRKAMLVKPQMEPAKKTGKYWVVKKVLGIDSWTVYERLAYLEDLRSISPLVWVARDSQPHLDCIWVGAALDGLSLHEYLQTLHPLSYDVIKEIVLGLSMATVQLHTIGIIYLNWTSTNVLISQNESFQLKVKLINFDAAVLADKENKAIMTATKLKIPVHLLPPEVLSESGLVLSTDCWGLGCLLFELTTGFPIWHEHRHLDVRQLEDVMRERRHPSIPETDAIWKHLLASCWKVDPADRMHAEDIQNFVMKYQAR